MARPTVWPLVATVVLTVAFGALLLMFLEAPPAAPVNDVLRWPPWAAGATRASRTPGTSIPTRMCSEPLSSRGTVKVKGFMS